MRRFLRFAAGILIAYLVISYFLLPEGWRLYGHRHPALENAPTITHTRSGIPGDPLNLAFTVTVG
jgi:hypothetical protein